jgi:hypothetical protein
MIAFLRIIVIRHHSEEASMMNTLPKSLTIAFLAVSILISGLTVDFGGAQNTAAGTVETQRSADQLLSRYLRFGRITADDGLSSNQIYNIAQDNHDFVWSILEDKSGVLWVGTED